MFSNGIVKGALTALGDLFLPLLVLVGLDKLDLFVVRDHALALADAVRDILIDPLDRHTTWTHRVVPR